MNSVVASLLLFASGIASLRAQQLATPATKPTVYNHVTEEEGSPLDREVRDAYATKFSFVDLPASVRYTAPKPTAGGLPKVAHTDKGEPLYGYILAAYVVTADGRVIEPIILRSTDGRLDAAALEAIKQWRFNPAQADGKPISTAAAQDFVFAQEPLPPGTSKGFALDRLVLYQPGEVLQTRCENVEEIAGYVTRLKAVCAGFFFADTRPETLHIVVAVRPHQRSRVWFASPTRSSDDAELSALRKKLEFVRACDVKNGPVVFALSSKLAGGSAVSDEEKEDQPPFPKEWQSAVKASEELQSVDGVLDLVWRDKP